ncbi:hypothetical protein HAX54_035036 [Datura stramonium]|uniref:Protein kinase domain-containing protein n=1 Tax=Datura stramonium TaxID=4076 RepID=A0ABS8SEZ0_DATST|nr:hypothetical protein [Datura stramonium]
MFVMMHSVHEVAEMGCCGCFGFSFARKSDKVGRPNRGYGKSWSREPLLQQEVEEGEVDGFDSGDIIDTERSLSRKHTKLCAQRIDGSKMDYEYARRYKIGAGSYGKVVLYKSCTDGKYYAIKAFHKSHLLKLRVAPGGNCYG